jgi:3-methyladenine DNA glycosylase AlkC
VPVLRIPSAPKSIQKGIPLKMILDKEAIHQLGENLYFISDQFDKVDFVRDALDGLEPLGIKERSDHIADSLRKHLPNNYSKAIEIILKSLTPPLEKTEDNGLASLFYMPHCSYIAKYGVDRVFNNDMDPFDISMHAQYELTQRFTCEFSIRPFIIHDQDRTLKVLNHWMTDKNPHVRRLCSEGTRPRLPWSKKIDSLVKDPSPSIPILEQLKNDSGLYVRRSVANHVGDIAKDHLEWALELCENWLVNASPELKWVIRHALRNPVKKGNKKAINLRKAAK